MEDSENRDTCEGAGTIWLELLDGAGRYRPVTVTVGFKGDDLWEITSGLKEGDRVVDGAEFMMDADSKLQAVFEAMDTETPVSN